MKKARILSIPILMLFSVTILSAQIDYLAQARQLLDEGNCEGAKTFYDLSKTTDKEFEMDIATCYAEQALEAKYKREFDSLQQEYQKNLQNYSENLQRMKAVYEALLDGDCDKANHEYIVWHSLNGFEDLTIERHIKECKKNKEYNKSPEEEVFEVGNMEYYVYLKGIKMSWTAASDAAKVSRVGGHSDWRVPTVAELQIVLQQIDGKTYEFSNEDHWSLDMTLYKDGSGKCYYVYNKTWVGSHSVKNKIPSGLCYCILVRTKR